PPQIPGEGRRAVAAGRGGRPAAGLRPAGGLAMPAHARGGSPMMPHRLYVGTIGEGLFRSLDGGLTFRRACDGTFVECDVRALAVHPQRPNVLYMGTELGLFRSADGADRWTQVEGPL